MWLNIYGKKLDFGVPSQKTLFHLENKESPLYEISEAGDLWREGYLVVKVTFVELDMRALIERLC